MLARFSTEQCAQAMLLLQKDSDPSSSLMASAHLASTFPLPSYIENVSYECQLHRANLLQKRWNIITGRVNFKGPITKNRLDQKKVAGGEDPIKAGKYLNHRRKTLCFGDAWLVDSPVEIKLQLAMMLEGGQLRLGKESQTFRVLGLPLQLWNSDTMKKIGDECGGWLENEEETELRNHLRWARIRCEEPATYRKRSPEKRNDDDRLKEKKSNPSTAMPMEAFQNRGMEFTEESISKYEINKKRERWIDKGHMLSVGSYLGERELCVGGPSCGQLEREMSREKEIQNQGFCGGPRKHSSFNLKGNSSPIDSGPKQKKQPFTEPFTEFINRTNTEACKSVYFVYFKGEDKLNIEAAG
ncbi:hypothetical protein BC332_24143 [Capsicum chinense]|nr:hypothetical protein BC332_24143 [Capsicum chinense]